MGVVNCGFACHTAVAAKDYIFGGVRQEVNGVTGAVNEATVGQCGSLGRALERPGLGCCRGRPS